MGDAVDPDKMPSYRTRMRLQALIVRTWQSVPAYRALWREAGVDDALISNAAAAGFRQLPVIGRQDLQRFTLAERCRAGVRLDRISIQRSSGSGGAAFQMPLNLSARARRQWRFARGLLACGYVPGQRLMLLDSRRPSLLSRRSGLSRVDLTLGAKGLAEQYLRIRPHMLFGPLNTLQFLARGLREMAAHGPAAAVPPAPDSQPGQSGQSGQSGKRGKLGVGGNGMDSGNGNGFWRPQAVISSGEQLVSAERRRLQQAFGPDPGEFYSLCEGGVIAWRLGGTDRFVGAGRQLLFEFLPSHTEPGLERLVVTDLAGGVMPLIRYDTGDLVQRDHAHPDLPIIQVRGRQDDCISLPDGQQLSPKQINRTMETLAGLERYHVVQRSDLSLDVRVWLRPMAAETALNGVTKRLKSLLGGRVEVRLSLADRPPPEGLRKFRHIRSEARAEDAGARR